MKVALLHENGGLRTYVVVLATGDEAAAALASVAREYRLGASDGKDWDAARSSFPGKSLV